MVKNKIKINLLKKCEKKTASNVVNLRYKQLQLKYIWCNISGAQASSPDSEEHSLSVYV